jgi:hypothetical protein
MFNSLPNFHRGRQLRLYGTLLAVSMLAACADNDEPTSPMPKPTATPKAAVGRILTGTISWKMLDEKNAVVAHIGAEFMVSGPNGYSLWIADNDGSDGDLALGQVKLAGLHPGSYTVCELQPVQHYIIVGPECVTVQLNIGGAVSLTFFNPYPAALQWGVTDEVGNYIGGGPGQGIATFTALDSLGNGFQMPDNSYLDQDPFFGHFSRTLPHEGTYALCEVQAPVPWILPAGKICKTIVVKYGQIYPMGDFVNVLPYSANWGVTDGTKDANNNYIPLAGSKFTVAFQRGLSKISVDDNGQNDYDLRPGRVAVKLSSAGSYTVCAVQAPTGHWLPKPACTTINVASGVPSSAGWFVMPEAQVIKP